MLEVQEMIRVSDIVGFPTSFNLLCGQTQQGEVLNLLKKRLKILKFFNNFR